MNYLTKLMGLVSIGSLAVLGVAQAAQLHPLESYSAYYEQKGMMSGETSEHCRDYCNWRVEISDLKVKMAGMVMPGDNKRVISHGAQQMTINYKKGTVAEFNNPFYNDMVSRAENGGAIDAAKFYLTQTGAVETNENAEINGYACRVWVNAQLGTKLCYDENMVLVYRHTNMMGQESEQILTKLLIGDDGGDDLYIVPTDLKKVELPDMPAGAPANLKAIMDALKPKN